MLLSNDSVPTGYDSASDYLSRGLKGHHDPLRAARATIRGEFNSVNRALNLVHTADDSDNLLRELSILLDTNRQPDIVSTSSEPRLFDFPALITHIHEWLMVEHGHDLRLRAACRCLLEASRTRLAAATGRHVRQLALIQTLEDVHRLASGRRDELGRLACDLSDRTRFATLDYRSLFARLAAAGLALDDWARYLLQTSLYYMDPAT
jgi:hypothetical protein